MVEVEIVMVVPDGYNVFFGLRAEFWEGWMAAWTLDPDIERNHTG